MGVALAESAASLAPPTIQITLVATRFNRHRFAAYPHFSGMGADGSIT